MTKRKFLKQELDNGETIYGLVVTEEEMGALKALLGHTNGNDLYALYKYIPDSFSNRYLVSINALQVIGVKKL